MRARVGLGTVALAGALSIGAGAAGAVFDGPPPPQSMFKAARLTGANVVPGPGDPDGKGVLGLNPANRNHRLCWALELKRLDPVTAAYVHAGTAGESGSRLLTIFEDPAGRPGRGVSRGCVKGLDPSLVKRIIGVGRQQPSYVEIRTTAFPAGALRGLLALGVPVGALPEGR